MPRWSTVVLRVAAAVAVLAGAVLVAADVAGAEPGFAATQAIPVPSGQLSHDDGVGPVSCPTSTSCTAIGTEDDGTPFAVTATSGIWGTPQVLATPADGVGGELGVTCPSVGNCLAAGSYTNAAGALVTLLDEETSGSWGASTSLAPPADAETGATAYATFATPYCASAGTARSSACTRPPRPPTR